MSKFTIFLSLLIMLSLIACTPQPKEATFELTNNTSFERIDEGVIISRVELLSALGTWDANNVLAVYYENKEPISYQLDDLDGDGKWDELFFVTNITKESSTKIIIRETNPADIPTFKKRTNIRFADINPPNKELKTAKRLSSTDTKISQKHFQMEGPAWENEKVAFRNYFDARNGIDIYGKRVSEMILDKVGINGQNYHELDDWGMDILSVGTSLGAGAIAMEVKDSIYRINYSEGANINIISEGPVRSIFELNFPQWKAGNRSYDINHQISIQAGKNYYQSKVTINGLQGDEKLVTGLVNIHNDTLYSNSTANTMILSTHEKQAYDKEYLGMAILVNAKDFSDTFMAPEEGDGVIQTHLIKLKISNNNTTTFRSYACWEFEHENYSTRSYFNSFLLQEGKEWNTAVKINHLTK